MIDKIVKEIDVTNKKTRIGGRKIHPFANKHQMHRGDEWLSFKKDIEDNGQRVPILLTPYGAILDGRNRARACEELNREVRFEQLPVNTNKTEMLAMVKSYEKRRHETPVELAILTAKHHMIMFPKNRNGEIKPNVSATAREEGVDINLLRASWYLLQHRKDVIEAVEQGITVKITRKLKGRDIPFDTLDVVKIAKFIKAEIENRLTPKITEGVHGWFDPDSIVKTEAAKTYFTIRKDVLEPITGGFSQTSVLKDLAAEANHFTELTTEIRDLKLKIGTLNGILGNEQI